jgi:hypothetical protein
MLAGFDLKYTKNRKRLLAIPHDCAYFAGGWSQITQLQLVLIRAVNLVPVTWSVAETALREGQREH